MGTGAGQIAEDEDFADIARGSNLRPHGRLVAAAVQAIASATQTAITFTAEEIDSHSFHSTGSNTARVTPNIPGTYRFSATLMWSSGTAAGTVDGILRKNGTTNLAPAGRAAGTTQVESRSCTALIPCDGVADYVELTGLQSTGVSRNTNQSVQYSSVLEWEFVAD